jgi:hypothetical protein
LGFLTALAPAVVAADEEVEAVSDAFLLLRD